jgi:UDPglucose--hexose-1-phosphate uridylyltransferase
MSELRYNLISREWVIIATERAKRPHDFIKQKQEKKPVEEYRKDCPFCRGNENQTPRETFRIEKSGWQVRSVYNKFGALANDIEPVRKNSGLYSSISGFGVHEVIVEHPLHNLCIPLMGVQEVQDIILAYKNRYQEISQCNHVKHIVIFKNHGSSAGTSLEHPHSQLIATPLVPPQSRSRLEQAANYFDLSGRCLFCQTLEEELAAQERIVLESDEFVSFVPYAPLSPFHIWIFPRKHVASFSQINEREIASLAANLKGTLTKLYLGLDNPDYNYVIRSLPVKEQGVEYFHWYLSIIPRVSQPAGFELGSGMFINTSLPEEAANFLRQIH